MIHELPLTCVDIAENETDTLSQEINWGQVASSVHLIQNFTCLEISVHPDIFLSSEVFLYFHQSFDVHSQVSRVMKEWDKNKVEP